MYSINFADVGEKVTSGSIAVKLQYYILGLPIVVLDDTYDICGAETGLTCPLDEGNHNVKFENEIPSSSPGVSLRNCCKICTSI